MDVIARLRHSSAAPASERQRVVLAEQQTLLHFWRGGLPPTFFVAVFDQTAWRPGQLVVFDENRLAQNAPVNMRLTVTGDDVADPMRNDGSGFRLRMLNGPAGSRIYIAPFV